VMTPLSWFLMPSTMWSKLAVAQGRLSSEVPKRLLAAMARLTIPKRRLAVTTNSSRLLTLVLPFAVTARPLTTLFRFAATTRTFSIVPSSPHQFAVVPTLMIPPQESAVVLPFTRTPRRLVVLMQHQEKRLSSMVKVSIAVEPKRAREVVTLAVVQTSTSLQPINAVRVTPSALVTCAVDLPLTIKPASSVVHRPKYKTTTTTKNRRMQTTKQTTN